MTLAPVFALAAAATGVAGAWDLLAGPEPVPGARWLRTAMGPVARARVTGEAASRAEHRRLVLLAVAGVLTAAWLLAGPLPGLVAAVLAPGGVGALLARRRRAYRRRLARAAAPAARALAATLAAGRTVRVAVGEAAAALDGPARVELGRCAAVLAAGGSTEHALLALRDRAASPAWNGLVAAVLLQREAGGDLPGLLRDLAVALEDAERSDADARTATAQARFTAQLVGALPLLAVAGSEVLSPGFVAGLLASPVSIACVVVAVLLQVAALVAVRQIARGLAAP